MSAPDVVTAPSGGKDRGRPWQSALVLVGLALLAGAMVLPWWTLSSSSASGFAAFEFGLTYLCVRPSAVCTAYGPLVTADPGYRAMADVFGVAFVLSSLAFLLAFVALLLRAAGERRPFASKLSPPAGLAAAVIAVVAPVYLLIALPGAFAGGALPSGSMLTGFFGSVSGSGVTLRYGGSYGWALSLLACPLLLLGSGFRPFRRRRQSAHVR